MTTTEEKVTSIIEYYKNLLIIQYHNKPKAQATIEAVMAEILGDGLAFSLERAFDIDTAVGPALTYVGKYVGVPRTIYGFGISRKYFEFTDYNIPDVTDFIGFRTYDTNPEPGSYFWSYTAEQQVAYELTDEEMRFLISLKIQTNNTISSYSELKRIVYEFFQDDFQVYDNRNMFITIISSLTISQLGLLAITQGFFPMPACVGTIYLQVLYPTMIFGFTNYDNDPTNSRGFSKYDTIKIGSFVSYANSVTI